MSKYKLFDITCKQATFLSAKKEEGKLALRERFLLYLHLKTCGPCRNFIRQCEHISTFLHFYKNRNIPFSDLTLSLQSKSTIRQKIDELIKTQK